MFYFKCNRNLKTHHFLRVDIQKSIIMRPSAILQSHMTEILQFEGFLIAQPEQRVEPPKASFGVEGSQSVLIPNAIVVLQVIVAIALQVIHVVEYSYKHYVRYLNALQFLKLSLNRVPTNHTSCKRFSGAFQAQERPNKSLVQNWTITQRQLSNWS